MDLVGRKVGNYVVTRKLGAGGMGTVYVCEHPLIGHRLAMKVLHEEHAGDPDQVTRFFQEARAAASIGHENIISVIDYGTLDTERGPMVYIMMELLAGQSLTARKREVGMSWPEVMHVIAQCCRALQACHARGIVHRDLKPENIYVCPRESDPLFVKIMDFGIAKLLDPSRAAARTRLGIALGTPAYMSPEQCSGRGQIDGRSDIYSLGVVMYELICGRLPFGEDLGVALKGHLYEAPPPPRSVDPSIPEAIEAVCLHALEKDRGRRFQSMAEMLLAVNDPAGHLAAWQARPAPAPGHSGRTMVLPAAEPAIEAAPAPPAAALASTLRAAPAPVASAVASPSPREAGGGPGWGASPVPAAALASTLRAAPALAPTVLAIVPDLPPPSAPAIPVAVTPVPVTPVPAPRPPTGEHAGELASLVHPSALTPRRTAAIAAALVGLTLLGLLAWLLGRSAPEVEPGAPTPAGRPEVPAAIVDSAPPAVDAAVPAAAPIDAAPPDAAVPAAAVDATPAAAIDAGTIDAAPKITPEVRRPPPRRVIKRPRRKPKSLLDR